ncbi:IscS subfamily cysteine desulfurase [Panacagrimonas perspica]|uniref:cysteine desulfurase family protein n=1 Tax=Panacagrimonas perspica TaxID=381431 RepID=UPI00105FC9E3|nr:aminotransferase class V-fold PLP-dependent enzyme [Panacagrimonas perspica]THD02534.1 IscS subfamily cysteine desulfurase [Panacagrimonas perspica]
MRHVIYLDHAATTPLAPEAWTAMRPWLEPGGGYGNPASAHAAGRQALAAVEAARAQVAALVGAQPEEIVWTSGATESNNLAIKGAVEFHARGRAHVITSRIEHRCVLDTCRWLEGARNVRVTYLQPDRLGRIEPQQVIDALSPETVLVSLMWANNEIGNLTDIPALAPQLRERGVMLHVDAAQAAGKVAIDLCAVPVDLLSLSAHKLGGPKGVGALFVRRRPRARVAPLLHGGGHEWGMRSGTLATHQVVGMGAAFASLPVDFSERTTHLRERLWQRLAMLPGVQRNGDARQAAPHILNLSFDGVEGESLRAALFDVAVSSGAACSSATAEPSYVLRALGRNDELANASLRFSFGRTTCEADIDAAAARVEHEVLRLRALSPLTN